MKPIEKAPVGVRPSVTYLPQVESLRGIAILLVVFFHADGIVTGGASETSVLLAFLHAGHTGVSLFFVLSGFLLSLPFLAEMDGGKRVALRDYVARRALRILPLYYAAVITGSILSAGTAVEILRSVPFLLFLNSVGLHTPMPPYSDVWWSLATEVHFYLLLPLLSAFMRIRSGRQIAMVLVTGYAMAYLLVVLDLVGAGTINRQLLLSHSVFGRGPLFLEGICAAFLYLRYGVQLRHALGQERWLCRGGSDAILIGICAAQGFLLRWLVQLGYWEGELPPFCVWHVLEGALWAIVLLLLLLAPLRLGSLLSNRALSHLGLISYSLYVLHLPLLRFGIDWLRTWKGAAFGSWDMATLGAVIGLLLVLLVLSNVTYRMIERPFLIRKARIDG